LSGRRIRTAVYGVFVACAAAFVLLSARAVVWGVFGLDATESASTMSASAAPACAEKIGGLARALDRGVAAAASARTQADARARMQAALAPEWDQEAATAATCTQDPRGADAWAALLRLKRAEEDAVERRAQSTGAIHRQLEAYLPR
jgi:hypothetical protein